MLEAVVVCATDITLDLLHNRNYALWEDTEFRNGYMFTQSGEWQFYAIDEAQNRHVADFMFSNVIPFRGDRDRHIVMFRMTEEATVLLYDSSRQHVVDTLKHDISNENFLFFNVDSSAGNMIHVEPQWSLDGSMYDKSGWVSLSENIIVHVNHIGDSKIPLYSYPSYDSDTLLVDNKQESFFVIKYENGWVFTYIQDAISGIRYEGWLSPISQCDAIYTTCN